MKMLWKVCVVVAGLVFAAGGLVGYLESRPKVAQLQCPDAVQALGELSFDIVQSATFTIVNPSDAPLRIVGSTSQCGGGICHRAQSYAIVIIPAHGEVQHVRLFGIAGLGPFDAVMPLYVEDVTGLRTIELRITGVGIAPAKPPQQ